MNTSSLEAASVTVLARGCRGRATVTGEGTGKATFWGGVPLPRLWLALALAGSLSGVVEGAGTVGSPAVWLLVPRAEVDGQGVFLSQLVVDDGRTLPVVRVADSPGLGQVVTLTLQEVMKKSVAAIPQLISTNWGGASAVNVYRRARKLSQEELLLRLKDVLQSDHVGERGELELRLMRPWTPVLIPDESLTVKVLDLPNSGVTPYFIARFELLAGEESLGVWHASLQAQIWKEIWVARGNLPARELLTAEDVVRERRDILSVREALVEDLDSGYELVQGLRPGMPIYLRSVRVRPVVFRGQTLEALVRTGPVSVSLKVEALQDGAPGDVIRVRNTQSRREFRGKVENEQTILVSL